MLRRLQLWLSTLPKKKLVGLFSVFVFVLVLGAYFIYQKFSADEFIDTRMNISGRVFDADAKTSLAGVKVSFISRNYDGLGTTPAPLEYTSDALGAFNVTLPDEVTYDLVLFEKEGYFDIEGTYALESATSEPKEVTLAITMKPGFGRENVHLQTIMPKWNLISSPLVPEDSNPASFFTYYSVAEDNLNIKKSQLNLTDSNKDTELYRWENANQGLKVYDQWSSDDFGPIEAGAGYWLEYKGETPKTIVMRGKQENSLPNGTFNIAKAGWALIGLPTINQMRMSEIGIEKDGQLMTINEAFGKGEVEEIYYWDNGNQGLLNYNDWSGEEALAEVGSGYWIKTKNDNTKIFTGQTFIGHMQTPNGIPLPGVNIGFMADSTNTYNPSQLATTDANGNFSMTNLNPAYKWITIQKNGYVKIEATVTTKESATQYLGGLNFLLEPGEGTKYVQIVPLKKDQKTNFGLSIIPSSSTTLNTIVKEGDNYVQKPLQDQISAFELSKEEFIPMEADKFTNSDGDQLTQELTGSTSGSIDSNTYIFGGIDKATNKPTDMISYYDPVSQSINTLNTKLPKPLTGAGSFTLPGENTIIIFGGATTDSQKSDSIYALSTDNDTINRIGSTPAHERYQVVNVDGNLVLIGEDSNAVTVHLLNLKSLTQQIKSGNCLVKDATCSLNLVSSPWAPTTKIGIGSTPYYKNGKLYFFGGVKNGNPVNSIYAVPTNPMPTNDSSLNQLSQTLPYPVAYSSSLALSDSSKLYLMGGKSENGDLTDKITAISFADPSNIGVSQIDHKLSRPSGDVAFSADAWDNLHVFSSSAYTEPDITINENGDINEGEVPEIKYNQVISPNSSLKPGQVYSITPSSSYALVIVSSVDSPERPLDFETASLPTQSFMVSKPNSEYFITSSSLGEEPLKHYKFTFEGEEYNLKQAAEQNLINSKIKIDDREIDLASLPTQDLSKTYVSPGSVLSFTDKADMYVTRDYDDLEPAYSTGYMLIDELVKGLKTEGLNDVQVDDILNLLNNCTPSFFDRRSGDAEREECLNSLEEPRSFRTEDVFAPVSAEKPEKGLAKANPLVKGAEAISVGKLWDKAKGAVLTTTRTVKAVFGPDYNVERDTKRFVEKWNEPHKKARTAYLIKDLGHEKRLSMWYSYYIETQENHLKFYFDKRFKYKNARYNNPFYYKRFWFTGTTLSGRYDNFDKDPANAWYTSKKLDYLYAFFWPDLKKNRYQAEFTPEERSRLEMIVKTMKKEKLNLVPVYDNDAIRDETGELAINWIIMPMALNFTSKTVIGSLIGAVESRLTTQTTRGLIKELATLTKIEKTMPKVVQATKVDLDLALRSEAKRSVSAGVGKSLFERFISDEFRPHTPTMSRLGGLGDDFFWKPMKIGEPGVPTEYTALESYYQTLLINKRAVEWGEKMVVEEAPIYKAIISTMEGKGHENDVVQYSTYELAHLLRNTGKFHPSPGSENVLATYNSCGDNLFPQIRVTDQYLDDYLFEQVMTHEDAHWLQGGYSLSDRIIDAGGACSFAAIDESLAEIVSQLNFQKMHPDIPVPSYSYPESVNIMKALIRAYERKLRREALPGQVITYEEAAWKLFIENNLKGNYYFDTIFLREAIRTSAGAMKSNSLYSEAIQKTCLADFVATTPEEISRSNQMVQARLAEIELFFPE